MNVLERVHPEDRKRTCDKCGYAGMPDMSIKLDGNVLGWCAFCRKRFGHLKLVGSPQPLSDN